MYFSGGMLWGQLTVVLVNLMVVRSRKDVGINGLENFRGNDIEISLLFFLL